MLRILYFAHSTARDRVSANTPALLHAEGYTIRGVQKILREHGVDQVKAAALRGAPADKATVPAPAARKRGRKPIANAESNAPARRPVLAPTDAVSAEARNSNVPVLTAIRELQMARAILLGQPLNQLVAPAEAKKGRASRTSPATPTCRCWPSAARVAGCPAGPWSTARPTS